MVLPSMPTLAKSFLPFRCINQNFVCISHFYQLIPLDLTVFQMYLYIPTLSPVICYSILFRSTACRVMLFLAFILTFHIWVVNNLTERNAAHLSTHSAPPPAISHGTVWQAHAQFTGQVDPVAKQRVLHRHWQRHRMDQFAYCIIRSFANPHMGQMLTLLRCFCRP